MIDLLKLTSEWRSKISRLLNCSEEEASDGELTAFTSFAISFPNTFVALIDTYDVAKYVHTIILLFPVYRLYKLRFVRVRT